MGLPLARERGEVAVAQIIFMDAEDHAAGRRCGIDRCARPVMSGKRWCRPRGPSWPLTVTGASSPPEAQKGARDDPAPQSRVAPVVVGCRWPCNNGRCAQKWPQASGWAIWTGRHKAGSSARGLRRRRSTAGARQGIAPPPIPSKPGPLASCTPPSAFCEMPPGARARKAVRLTSAA
jgi:hypothetical protein